MKTRLTDDAWIVHTFDGDFYVVDSEREAVLLDAAYKACLVSFALGFGLAVLLMVFIGAY